MTRKLAYSRSFREGYYASKRGVSKSNNPYLGRDDTKYDEWQWGWEAHYYKEVVEENVKPLPKKR